MATFKTQAEVDREIDRLIARGDVAEKKRDRAAFESPEYWHWHDVAVKWWTRAESLMPGGSYWKRSRAA